MLPSEVATANLLPSFHPIPSLTLTLPLNCSFLILSILFTPNRTSGHLLHPRHLKLNLLSSGKYQTLSPVWLTSPLNLASHVNPDCTFFFTLLCMAHFFGWLTTITWIDSVLLHFSPCSFTFSSVTAVVSHMYSTSTLRTFIILYSDKDLNLLRQFLPLFLSCSLFTPQCLPLQLKGCHMNVVPLGLELRTSSACKAGMITTTHQTTKRCIELIPGDEPWVSDGHLSTDTAPPCHPLKEGVLKTSFMVMSTLKLRLKFGFNCNVICIQLLFFFETVIFVM